MAEKSESVAIVTGASSGIGWATALAFARRGTSVVAVARREDRLRALVDEIRGAAPRSFYLAGDLGERAFAERIVDESAARLGRVDVLVNNAAVPMRKLLYRTTRRGGRGGDAHQLPLVPLDELRRDPV